VSTHPDNRFRIGVDTLESGKIKAVSRGGRPVTRTFAPGTPHADVALSVAELIETRLGRVVSHVQMVTGRGDKSDWQIFIES
jgi:hypothetical protein